MQCARITPLGAYLRAPTPRDSRSVPSDRAKCHSDRAVRPLRFSRRRPRRADHHRHPGSVGWRGPMHGGCRPNACMGFSFQPQTHVSAWHCMGGCAAATRRATPAALLCHAVCFLPACSHGGGTRVLTQADADYYSHNGIWKSQTQLPE